MKDIRFIAILLLLAATTVSAQDADSAYNSKSGWNIIPLPIVSYHSDLGFQFGALATIYDYGDGSYYPDYKHLLYFELSLYTKLSGIARVSYDSQHLIPGYRVTANLGFFPNKAYSFFGFNGYRSVYRPEFITTGEESYKSRVFYNYQNYQTRFMVDLQKNINPWLKWIAGVNLWNFNLQSVDVDFINRGKESDLLPAIADEPGLYERYIAYGIIPKNEADGGFVANIKAGIVADTRDFDANPSQGIWTELLMNMAPGFIGNTSPHIKLVAMHRQYFPLAGKRLIFAYRVGYQGTIAGNTPFYMQSQLQTSFIYNLTNAVGGAESVRGILYNRLLADGFAIGNAELRWRTVDFRFLGQNCFLGFNLFADAAVTVQKIDFDEEEAFRQAVLLDDPAVPGNPWAFSADDYFDFSSADTPHYTMGGGIKIGFNENTIISADIGKALNPRDGSLGVYIGMDFMF